MNIAELADGTKVYWNGPGTYYSTDGKTFKKLGGRQRDPHYVTKFRFIPRATLTFELLNSTYVIPSRSKPK